jgi:hypothetical protein
MSRACCAESDVADADTGGGVGEKVVTNFDMSMVAKTRVVRKENTVPIPTIAS